MPTERQLGFGWRPSRPVILTGCCVLFAVVCCPVQAGTVALMHPDADAFINGRTPDETVKATNALFVHGRPNQARFSCKVYLGFVLPDKLEGFDGVELTLRYWRGTLPTERAPIRLYGIREGDAADAEDGWDANVLTWNNAPAHDVSCGVGVDPDRTQLLAEINVEPGVPGVRFADPRLTAFIQNDVNGRVSFILTGTKGAGAFLPTEMNPTATHLVVFHGEPTPPKITPGRNPRTVKVRKAKPYVDPASLDWPDWQGDWMNEAEDVPDYRRYGRWRASRINGGGYIQETEFCPSDPDRMYAFVDVAGVYRSDDAGRTWRSLQGSMPAEEQIHEGKGLVVCATDADRVLYLYGNVTGSFKKGGVYLTTDGGGRWKKTLTIYGGNQKNNGRVLARHPADPMRFMVAGIVDGLWESRDGGETWICLGLKDISPSDIHVDTANTSRIWVTSKRPDARNKAVVEEGVFFSDDDGRTWEKVSDLPLDELAQNPAEPGRLIGTLGYREVLASTDGGRTWSHFMADLPYVDPKKKPGRVKHATYRDIEAGPDFVLASTMFGTFYTLHAGENAWVKTQPERLDVGNWWGGTARGWGGLASVSIDPRNANRWFYSSAYAVGVTEDAGKTFTLSMEGMEATVPHGLYADPQDPQIVHLAMSDNGIFRSVNGGLSFERSINAPVTDNKFIVGPRSDPNRLYSQGANGWAVSDLFRSDDRGLSWRSCPAKGLGRPPSFNNYNTILGRIPTIAVHPTNPNEFYAGVGGEVRPNLGGAYRSTDGGDTFTWFGQGMPEGDNFFVGSIWALDPGLAISTDGTMVTVACWSAQVCRFDPGTGRWGDVATLDAKPRGVYACPHLPERFYIAAESCIYRSDDSGRTWQSLAAPDGRNRIIVDAHVKGRLALSHPKGMQLSPDGGESWEEIGQDLPYKHGSKSGCIAGNRLIIFTPGMGVFWTELAASGEEFVTP